MRNSIFAASLALVLLSCAAAGASEYEVSDAVFAVVTHKGGFASGSAHNHLIAATDAVVELELDPSAVTGLQFRMQATVEKLDVDPAELEEALADRFQALGLFDADPFAQELSDKDRGKIRESMLGKSQLDAEHFPGLEARVVKVEEKASTWGEQEFPYEVTLAFTAHGTEVQRPVAARFEWDGESVRVEAVGLFRFTDFGIKPFSAFLGAVKNLDDLHLYVRFTATPGGE